MKKKFSGGIQLAPSTEELKKLFKAPLELTRIEPDYVVIPVSQHIGAPNEVLVAVGDNVAEGQLIARNSATVSGYVHASIGGIVTAIEEVPGLGEQQLAIRIQRGPAEEVRLSEMSPLETVRHAGIVGMGGATFPTHVKLDPDPEITVHTVVLNGAECEPFLLSDNLLMIRESDKIIRGGRIMQELLGAKRILVGIEADKPQAIAAMAQAAAPFPDIEVVTLPTIYPQGGEKEILESLLRVESPMHDRTIATGAFSTNVATSKAVADAVDERRPLTRRYVTVTGDVMDPKIVEFPLGTTAEQLIDFCGGFNGAPSRILNGGPMMGKTLPNLEVPLTKGSNGLVVLNHAHDGKTEESPCIRCNRCVTVCPIRLEPHHIDLAYRSGNYARVAQLLAEECINCGCCTYVCPARRNLAANIVAAGNKVATIKEELAND